MFDKIMKDRIYQTLNEYRILTQVKELKNDTKYLIGVPIPEAASVSTAYIFVMASNMALERIGIAELGESGRSENEN